MMHLASQQPTRGPKICDCHGSYDAANAPPPPPLPLPLLGVNHERGSLDPCIENGHFG